ncbi:MAG TPA: hypothetical protein VKA84_26280 [Gemmatimonadaceae bacterium]|nr:hypothetical protein [Gemmatimonadaceae bacterium]
MIRPVVPFTAHLSTDLSGFEAPDQVTTHERLPAERRQDGVYVLLLDELGTIRYCSAAMRRRLASDEESVNGQSVICHLARLKDADLLLARVRTEDATGLDEVLPLEFLEGSGRAFTLHCKLDVQPGYCVLSGEPPEGDRESALEVEVRELRVLVAGLLDECEEQSGALREARTALARSEDDLHVARALLSRIQQAVPVCSGCEQTKGAPASWQRLLDCLTDYALFLTDLRCVECAPRLA